MQFSLNVVFLSGALYAHPQHVTIGTSLSFHHFL